MAGKPPGGRGDTPERPRRRGERARGGPRRTTAPTRPTAAFSPPADAARRTGTTRTTMHRGAAAAPELPAPHCAAPPPHPQPPFSSTQEGRGGRRLARGAASRETSGGRESWGGRYPAMADSNRPRARRARHPAKVTDGVRRPRRGVWGRGRQSRCRDRPARCSPPPVPAPAGCEGEARPSEPGGGGGSLALVRL